jgi:adenine-specific DNA methylase
MFAVQKILAPIIEAERAIENGFPIGFVSQLAEHESWRKEVYRPIYYIHKWWARRLGSVFRAIIIASCVDKKQDVARLFYEPIEFPDMVVFDPFMGSGTTIGEAVKLGCRVIGRDINPVSLTMVKAALQNYSEREVRDVFNQLSETAGGKIRKFYVMTLADGDKADVLYYFWVKTVPCPLCNYEMDLFKKRIFSKNAMRKKYPRAQAICPSCQAINEVRYDDIETRCQSCTVTYNPQVGTIRNGKVDCPSCKAKFSLINVVRRLNTPLQHRMYAKMVLLQDGRKSYLPIADEDTQSYRLAEEMLGELWEYVPKVQIKPGYNTNQVLNYNYTTWHQMFNARQLASLVTLATEIRKIEKPELRTLFACLFSGMLEFNNMFASFKGEGTGAVRHMFSHHILKPELSPIEANVWGTPKSSGSFSTLFQSRIMRALDYKARAFELKVSRVKGKPKGQKIFGLSRPINQMILSDYHSFSEGNGTYLSAGDSANTDLPGESIDLVITDPPFFDNVHYSQLADFFYVWLRQILGPDGAMAQPTTRSPYEVQHTKVEAFTNRLTSVFAECHRVLKRNGLLIFTYHHSRLDGWSALYKSVREAGFVVTQAHPIKAEMSVSVPIRQAKVPINFDLVLTCRKIKSGSLSLDRDHISLPGCVVEAEQAIEELQNASMKVSIGDAKIILMGCILSKLSETGNLTRELSILREVEPKVDLLAQEIINQGG